MKTLALILSVLTGCAAQNACQPDPISGAPRCDDTSGGPVEAVGVGGTATALYAAEGCKMNGCEPPFRCETVSQRCERISCGENADCPPGFDCDLENHRCR
jgi:hypothetical protein